MGGCQPQIVLGPGLGPARWTFDPAHPEPDAATQVFDALVTEMACNSGEPADGRIVGPEIVAGPDQVLVFFATRPRGGTKLSVQPIDPECAWTWVSPSGTATCSMAVGCRRVTRRNRCSDGRIVARGPS